MVRSTSGVMNEGERLYFVVESERGTENSARPAGARRLHSGEGFALMALAEGADPHVLHAEDGSSHLFHDGITPVPVRRQQSTERHWEMRSARAQSLLADPLIQSWVDSVSRTNLEDNVTTLSTDFTTRALEHQLR